MDEIKTSEIKSSMPEIFINFLSFLLLGIVATAAGVIFFQVINKYFPDVLSATYANYQISSYRASLIRYSIASLIVGFPIYFWAIWFWFRSFTLPIGGPEKSESKLSKWLTYIVLLIAGGTIIGDLITVIYNFLGGEYGARFLLKAAVILVIAGLIFGFYFLERKKIQYKKEISSGFWLIGSAAGILAVLAIVLGFLAGGTPGEARLGNLDLQRVNNLQMISSAISNFAFENSRLPRDLSEIRDNPRYNYGAGYIDPETKKDYDYKIINPGAGTDNSAEYELCATFSLSTLDEASGERNIYSEWSRHDKGYVCQKQVATFGTKNIKEMPAPVPPLK